MRKYLAVLVAVLFFLPIAAGAGDFVSCWVADIVDPVTLDKRVITRCRIAGGETVDYAADTDVPSVLYPNLGTDLTGPCWYLTSAGTNYIVITRYADGTADVGYDPDPAIPGGIIVVGPNLRRCTSEPAPAADPSFEAWEYVMSYVHDPPAPDLNPEPGRGVTGLATFVGVAIPSDHAATISSGISTVDVQIVVDAVVVHWGDGDTSTYPPNTAILSGYPEGTASHVYEIKDNEGLPLTVEYDWTARWRVSGGAWIPLPVPNTSTTVVYPVAEVVSRLSD